MYHIVMAIGPKSVGRDSITEKNPMLIFGVITVDGHLSYDDFIVPVEKLVGEQWRLRATTTKDKKFVPYENFNLDEHIHKVPDPAQNGETTESFISKCAEHTFDPSKPRWDFQFFHTKKIFKGMVRRKTARYQLEGQKDERFDEKEEEEEEENTRTILVFRAHHVIGDGMSFFYMLERMVEISRGSQALTRGVSQFSKLVVVRRQPIPCYKFLMWPLMSCYILPGMACMRRDAQCTIKPCGSELNGEKQIFWCKPLPIVEILQIAGSEGSESITSVLLSICSGAIRNFLESKGETPVRDIKAIVPFSLRSEKQTNLENKVSCLFVEIPVSESKRSERLRKCCRRMDDLKSGPYALIAVLLMAFVTFILPSSWLGWIQSYYVDRCSLIFSCVPGPRQTRKICNRRVESVFGFPPTVGNLALSIATFEFGGYVRIGMMTSKVKTGAGMRGLAEEFNKEFEELSELAAERSRRRGTTTFL